MKSMKIICVSTGLCNAIAWLLKLESVYSQVVTLQRFLMHLPHASPEYRSAFTQPGQWGQHPLYGEAASYRQAPTWTQIDFLKRTDRSPFLCSALAQSQARGYGCWEPEAGRAFAPPCSPAKRQVPFHGQWLVLTWMHPNPIILLICMPGWGASYKATWAADLPTWKERSLGTRLQGTYPPIHQEEWAVLLLSWLLGWGKGTLRGCASAVVLLHSPATCLPLQPPRLLSLLPEDHLGGQGGRVTAMKPVTGGCQLPSSPSVGAAVSFETLGLLWDAGVP